MAHQWRELKFEQLHVVGEGPANSRCGGPSYPSERASDPGLELIQPCGQWRERHAGRGDGAEHVRSTSWLYLNITLYHLATTSLPPTSYIQLAYSLPSLP